MVIRGAYRALLSTLPVDKRVSVRYYLKFGSFPDLQNPTSINEKVLRRILTERDPMFSFYADKLSVRGYISQRIGARFLVPLVSVFERAEDLLSLDEWSGIVVKPNHGAGMVKIIENEVSAQEKWEVVLLAKDWLSRDHSRVFDEWHYSKIPPRLLVEKKISDSGEDLRDYKFHRFRQGNGDFVQVLQVVAERSPKGFETAFFRVGDLDEVWYSPFGYKMELSEREKVRIAEIARMNECLCPEYSYLRLDWYITGRSVYFGEITFTPGGGVSRTFSGEFGEIMGGFWVD